MEENTHIHLDVAMFHGKISASKVQRQNDWLFLPHEILTLFSYSLH